MSTSSRTSCSALEVLARVGDARLGLLAALLVARDAGGLLDEGAHVIGARLDDARDHALLDDRVAARAEAGAEEQIGDVLAAAASAVDEVGRAAVARHLALQRDLGVAGVGAADLAVGIVEHQLDRGRADGLAREPEPLKMTSAMMSPRRCLADSSPMTQRTASMTLDLPQPLGPTTPVRLLGKLICGRIDEGLEAGELDLGQSHRLVSSVPLLRQPATDGVV